MSSGYAQPLSNRICFLRIFLYYIIAPALPFHLLWASSSLISFSSSWLILIVAGRCGGRLNYKHIDQERTIFSSLTRNWAYSLKYLLTQSWGNVYDFDSALLLHWKADYIWIGKSPWELRGAHHDPLTLHSRLSVVLSKCTSGHLVYSEKN